MTNAEEQARHYLLNEHSSPLTWIMHEADLKAEMQYHKDIENGYIKGYKQAEKDIAEHIKLTYGKVSMNPFDCSEAFEELLKTIGAV